MSEVSRRDLLGAAAAGAGLLLADTAQAAPAKTTKGPDGDYVVKGKIARYDLDKTFTWEHRGMTIDSCPEVRKHVEQFRKMKVAGSSLAPLTDRGDVTSYLWMWDEGPKRFARLILQRTLGEFDVDALKEGATADPVTGWMLDHYASVRAAVEADQYLKGAIVKLYLGGAGGD